MTDQSSDMRPYDLTGKRVWVAGHRGMVGSALVRRLQEENVAEVITAGRDVVDLIRQEQVEKWLGETKPDAIIVAAAKVGGILANDTYPADFLYDNLMIEANILKAAADLKTEKVLFLGSSCIYPKFAEQPIKEESLLTGALEPTNEWYAIAKIAGIKLCQAYRRQHGLDFISGMPTNLYGPFDNFDLNKSHVLPALIRKADTAKKNGETSLEVWGTGTPKREFLYVEDLADACIFLLKNYSGYDHVNIGYGDDVTIRELAETVMDVVGFEGDLRFDTSKPDGTPRKLMSSERLQNMGWKAQTDLKTGIRQAYQWYKENYPE